VDRGDVQGLAHIKKSEDVRGYLSWERYCHRLRTAVGNGDWKKKKEFGSSKLKSNLYYIRRTKKTETHTKKKILGVPPCNREGEGFGNQTHREGEKKIKSEVKGRVGGGFGLCENVLGRNLYRKKSRRKLQQKSLQKKAGVVLAQRGNDGKEYSKLKIGGKTEETREKSSHFVKTGQGNRRSNDGVQISKNATAIFANGFGSRKLADRLR